MISVYSTLTRRKEPFETVVPGKVTMYVCGPTVYSQSHVGHMVGPVLFDAIKRYLNYCGYQVTLVINITDIDDKIIAQANKEGIPYGELASRVTADYLDCLRLLDVHVDHFPRATETIPEILEMIGGLIRKGHAYAIGGDVYFDVTTRPDYGKLSNRRPEELLAGARKEVDDRKRNAGDFALWKGAKAGEPSWPSPWGPGRPGWHIECSAMCRKLLGDTLDIHGGGLDLCFPHHEDEIAQSESYTGKPLARYWLHNGLMQYSNATRKIGAREGDYASQEVAKMSKSTGNVITIRALLERHAPEVVRFFLLSTHYRRPIDFSDERIDEVGRGLARLRTLADRVGRILGKPFHSIAAPARRGEWSVEGTTPFLSEVARLRDRFLECMDDDLNTGGAVGVLFELLSTMNRFADDRHLEGSADDALVAEFLPAAVALRELTNILGVSLATAPPDEASHGLAPKLLDVLLEVRAEARKTKNFALSDLIRDRLKLLGVTIEDRPTGSQWKIASP